eukprot:scaffold3262_cov109-Isochrysis_galbana.AAC.5
MTYSPRPRACRCPRCTSPLPQTPTLPPPSPRLPTFPRSAKMSTGDTTVPSRLPSTALKTASGSSPFAMRVSAMHMLTVVGSAAVITMPSAALALSAPAAQSGAHTAAVTPGMSSRLNDWMVRWARQSCVAAPSW